MDKTRIQKTFFILTRDLARLAPDFDFRPDDCGPFSRALESALQRLKDQGLVSYDNRSKYAKPVKLEEKGKRVCDADGKDLDKAIGDNLDECIDLFEGLEHDEMLAFVGSMFPEMAVKSDEYGKRIKPNLQAYVVNLIKKDKITTGRGAELLKIPYIEMRNAVIN
ncbi:MAG: hypothetical protein MPJ78_20155 [Hyphomicrobiaceae bacterium]|nr:hypothetical protein [Hyphomicrobiaceae bacterium]